MADLRGLQTALAEAGRLVGPASVIDEGRRSSPNVFSVLGIERSEVIQSRFIAWLLDGTANHGHGTRFLSAFLEATGLPPLDAGGGSYDVVTESWEAEARTDIVVSRPGEFLLHIEHKIDAAEQPDQADREYRDMVEAGERLGVPRDRQFAIFLSPSGRPPTSGDASAWQTVSQGELAAAFAAVAEHTSDTQVRQLVQDWVAVTQSWRGVHRLIPPTDQTRFLVQNYDCFRELCEWADDLAQQLTSVAFGAVSECMTDDWQRDSGSTALWMTITRERWRTPSGATTLALVADGFTPQSLMGLSDWPLCYMWYSLKDTTDDERRRIEQLAADIRDAFRRASGVAGAVGGGQNRKIWLAELPRCTSGDIDEYVEGLRKHIKAFFGATIGVLDEMEPAIRRAVGR